MSSLRLITFDMTGTLLAFRTPVMEQYAAAAALFGVQSDPQRIQQNFKKTWKILDAKHPNFGQETGLGWREWWRAIVAGSFETENKEKVSEVADYLLKHFETSEAWCVTKGGSELLKTVRNENLTLGVISNFDPRLHTIMKNLDILHYFDFVITSYEVGFRKPDPRIFEEALRRGGVARAEEALHIGNDQILDMGGALRSGFNAVLVDQTVQPDFPHIVRNISDVAKSIQAISLQNK